MGKSVALRLVRGRSFLSRFKDVFFAALGLKGGVVVASDWGFVCIRFGGGEKGFVCLCSVGRGCLRCVGVEFAWVLGSGVLLRGFGAGGHVVWVWDGVCGARSGLVCGLWGRGGFGVRVAGRCVVALGSGRGAFPARVLLVSAGFVV